MSYENNTINTHLVYLYIRSCISTPTGTRSDDQLDEDPSIYSEVSNDPVINQSDDMIMSSNAAYQNNKTWLK